MHPVCSADIEDAVQLVASSVAEEIQQIQRARGTDHVAVAAARARIDELSIVLKELCRELARTAVSLARQHGVTPHSKARLGEAPRRTDARTTDFRIGAPSM